MPDPEKTSPPETASTGAASGTRATAFARWDTNGDGFLTLDEYQAGLNNQDNLEARFKNFDQNGDGKLAREEFVGPSVK